jgi:dGTPase
MNPIIKRHTETIRDLFTDLFHRFLTDLKNRNRSSPIFTGFLDGMSADYISGHRPPEIVRDFIAGMTDQYFLKQCPPDRASRLGMP